MTRRTVVLFSAAVVLMFSALPLQAALPLSEVLDQMDLRQRPIEDVTFQFVERLKRGSLPEERIAGKVRVQKPHTLRVDQTVPQKQVLISDGVTLWLYSPSQKQQIKGDWKAWVSHTHFPLPLIDFIGAFSSENWREHYTVLYGGYETPLYKLSFKPHRPGDLPMTLWVSEKTFLPVRGEMNDKGTQVQVELTDMQLNTKPATALFSPEVPAGTEQIPVSF